MKRLTSSEFSKRWRTLAEPVDVTVDGRVVARFTPTIWGVERLGIRAEAAQAQQTSWDGWPGEMYRKTHGGGV